jgi:ABC-type uncharacterized transport system substrate-binding protein
MALWRNAWTGLKSTALGLLLIALAALLLLASDWGHRRKPRAEVPRVALFSFASRPTLDDALRGVVEALAARGFVDGRTMKLQRFSAENDMPTATAIAKALVDGRFDLVITVTTPCFQAMASANTAGKVRHVFGVVTDPFASGVPIDRTNTLKRPPAMAGVGTFQPVKEAFRTARKLYPGLRRVGEVWCSSEACSEACTRLGREVSAELGITLEEATVDSSTGVLEAARSLVARGVQALWVGGDNTVEMATSSVVKAAQEGGIPVFTNAPATTELGALFGLGADYYEVGRAIGAMSADVLGGKDPGTIPIANVVPQDLLLNEKALAGLRDPWSVPEEIRRQAHFVARTATQATAPPVTAQIKALPVQAGKPPGDPAGRARPWRFPFLSYVEASFVEDALRGVRAELATRGLQEGRDVILHVVSAQGDMAALPTLIDSAVAERPDVILINSTVGLQAAVKRVTTVPVVFGNVANPILAGAGKSMAEHQANITGVAAASDYAGMARLLRECLPRAHRVGSLVVRAEANSVYNCDSLQAELHTLGIELVTVPVATSTDVGDAAIALCSQKLDAVCQSTSNLVDTSFAAVTRAARQSHTPLFAFSSTLATEGGAAVALARDYEAMGHEMVALALRIVGGESPAGIPFEMPGRTVLVVNPANAAACGLEVPGSVLARADKVVGR